MGTYDFRVSSSSSLPATDLKEIVPLTMSARSYMSKMAVSGSIERLPTHC